MVNNSAAARMTPTPRKVIAAAGCLALGLSSALGSAASPALALSPATSAPGAMLVAQGGEASDQNGHTDPALQQTVKDDERFAPRGEKHAFTKGHADLGVRLDSKTEGGMTMMLRDDAQEQPVWRHLEDVAFVVGDNSKQQLPDGGDYDFTGARAGQQVYVLPQTEKQGVPWLGWNTQSPALVKGVSRGVTMQLLGHQGPGQLTMFLQSGGFAKPQKIFNTAEPMPQGMFVDLNTHAHANWVFTEPGVHRVALGINAKTSDGKDVSGTKVVTFAVGVDAQEALSAGWQGQVPTVASADDATPGADSNSSQGGNSHSADTAGNSAAGESSEQSEGIDPVVWVLVGVGGLLALMVIGGLVMMRSGRSARREAEDQLRELRAAREAREAREARGQRAEHGREGNPVDGEDDND
ncbi:choice-of-anchor M domain-containing protein [Corynebacterium auriscanis]|uniref:choice-of-anchor M domain-containing protein n=1 Tax=Corynebacterium auriscanis TaxID=99807 RepID=UPI000B042FA0|nr:choice-of-anchor M domain-containing protein [Corynebacterium auriscanis]WJY73593.1 hypothetical protein CAURIC_09950 [Corynebacterium auriscanis]